MRLDSAPTKSGALQREAEGLRREQIQVLRRCNDAHLIPRIRALTPAAFGLVRRCTFLFVAETAAILMRWQHQLSLQPFKSLGPGPRSTQVPKLFDELRVEVAHLGDECKDRDDELRELQARNHLLEPRFELPDVRRIRRSGRWRLHAIRPLDGSPLYGFTTERRKVRSSAVANAAAVALRPGQCLRR
jgi:hypothetical protein